jgi:hypothetical protein
MNKTFMTSMALCLSFTVPATGLGQTGTAENTPGACQDGVDNDGDGLADCADQDCSLFIFCATPPVQPPAPVPPSPPAPAPAPAPAAAPVQPTYALPPENSAELCTDRQDNDADGLIDCQDPDCTSANLCNLPAAAPVKSTAKKKGGGGLYGSLVVFTMGKYSWEDNLNNANNRNEEWIMTPVTGGVGLFLELPIARFAMLGFEANLFFPKIDKEKAEGMPEIPCHECERDIFFSFGLRAKFPIKIGKFVAPYPLIMLGFGNYTWRREEQHARNYKGLAVEAAIGVEVYPLSFLTPFFECRYTFHIGFNSFKDSLEDHSEELQLHSVALVTGVRFQ